MLSKISPEIMKCYVETVNSKDAINPKDLFRDMFKQQPVLKLILQSVVKNDDTWPEEFKDGYCKGMLQAWYLLNQQAIIDQLEEDE